MKTTAEWEKEVWDEDLDNDSHKHYRKILGMPRWLVAERPDIMTNVSENLQSPKYRHWQQVKRIARYLAGRRDYVQKIEVNSDVIANKSANEHSFVGWSDTDFGRRRGIQEEHFLCSAQTGWSSHLYTFSETDVDCDKHCRCRNVPNSVGHI